MMYGSVCSGIEAATAAWHDLGWEAAWFAEIDPFCKALLKHRYPEVTNHGDFTQIGPGAGPVDLLVGGTPCQAFSVAGLRGGLDDERGNLTLEFLKLAGRLRPRWLVWENVPGVFSSLTHPAPDPCPPEDDLDGDDGPRDGTEVVVEDEYDSDEVHAFSCFLAGLSELGYGFACRTLDAQYFGVPQRRRRVFVVGYLGDWHPAAAVLFERHSLAWHAAPGREAGQGIAPTISARTKGGGGLGTDFDCDGGLLAFGGNNTAGPIGVATACRAKGGSGHGDFESETFVAHTLDTRCASATEDRTGRGSPLVPVVAPTLRAGGNQTGGHRPPGTDVENIAYCLTNPGAGGRTHNRQIAVREVAGTLRAGASGVSRVGGGEEDLVIPSGLAVRRLTPRECERLQGFPDDYTLIPYRGKPAADGPRYRAIGNSMAVPVMRWIGSRIGQVERIRETTRYRPAEAG